MRIQAGADILQTPLEDFKGVVLQRLAPEPETAAAEEKAEAEEAGEEASGLVRIYVIYDQRDGEAPLPLEDYLFRRASR